MNQNKTRQIIARQKLKAETQPLPENYTLPKLTAEQRKAIYAPKPASEAPQHLKGAEWVNAWRTVSRITYGITALSSLLLGGLVLGESKKSMKQ